MMRVDGRRARRMQNPKIDMLPIDQTVKATTICPLADAAAWPIQGLIRQLPDEIEIASTQAYRPRHRRRGE